MLLAFFFLHNFPLQVFCLKAYEKQKQTRKSTTQLQSKSGEREKVEKFKTTENSIVSKPINPFMFGNYQSCLSYTYCISQDLNEMPWLLILEVTLHKKDILPQVCFVYWTYFD